MDQLEIKLVADYLFSIAKKTFHSRARRSAFTLHNGDDAHSYGFYIDMKTMTAGSMTIFYHRWPIIVVNNGGVVVHDNGRIDRDLDMINDATITRAIIEATKHMHN